jgi:hypothetical protein
MNLFFFEKAIITSQHFNISALNIEKFLEHILLVGKAILQIQISQTVVAVKKSLATFNQ